MAPASRRRWTRARLKQLAKRSWDRSAKVQLSDRAAALAYFGFLSLFPALIVAVALLALFGSYPETYDSIISALRDAAPGTAVDTIDSALRDVLRGRGAGGLLGIGLLFAFITASGAVGAAIRALAAINGTREEAGFVRDNLTRLWLTLALMALFLIALASLLIAGPIFGSIAEAAGFGEAGRKLVAIARYPVGMAALLAATLLLYSRGPAATRRRLVEHLPGALLAALLWVLASLGFSLYVSKFNSYDATYGTLGAVIVLLVWIYVISIAMLIGAVVNREIGAMNRTHRARSSR